jgi:hypothetical protein
MISINYFSTSSFSVCLKVQPLTYKELQQWMAFKFDVSSQMQTIIEGIQGQGDKENVK